MDQSLRGPEEVKGVYRWLKAAFPDMRFEVVDMVAEDDKVWTLVVFSGTHEGEFMGTQPTGRRFEARQVHMRRVRKGKTIEHRAVRDDLAVVQQLGGHGGGDS